MAKVVMSGSLQGVALTCEKTVPILALGLGRAPARNPAQLTVTSGTATARLGIVRNGSTNVWVAAIRDSRVLDMLTQETTADVAIDGQSYGSVPLDGARAAVRTALAGCYTPAAAASASQSTSAGATLIAAANAGLPPAVARDLGDFNASCAVYDPYGFYPNSPGGRGVGLMPPDAVVRADFNGDGAQDYLLDVVKLTCSKPGPNSWPDHRIFVYTSLPDGSVEPTIDVPIDSYAVIGGTPATLHVHQDAVEDGDDFSHGVIDETLRMAPGSSWNTSTIARPNWRNGMLKDYPQELQALFAGWDRQCAAAGRRLDLTEGYGGEVVQGDFYDTGDLRKIDFNGDGKRDFVIDTDDVECGMFHVPPKSWPAPCGSNCALIALLSRPDGSFFVDPVPRSITFNGNGEPASLARMGSKTVVCFNENTGGDPGPYVRYSWTGTVKERAVRGDAGC